MRIKLNMLLLLLQGTPGYPGIAGINGKDGQPVGTFISELKDVQQHNVLNFLPACTSNEGHINDPSILLQR